MTGALLALGAAIGVTWYAPPAPSPSHWTQITRTDGTVVCGELLASDQGQVHLRRADASQVVRVPLAGVESLRPVDTCAGA
jgi:hypothetical protein